jgi:hypothetical protein
MEKNAPRNSLHDSGLLPRSACVPTGIQPNLPELYKRRVADIERALTETETERAAASDFADRRQGERSTNRSVAMVVPGGTGTAQRIKRVTVSVLRQVHGCSPETR